MATQWDKIIYFMLQNETSNEESIWSFIKLLINQFKLKINND